MWLVLGQKKKLLYRLSGCGQVITITCASAGSRWTEFIGLFWKRKDISVSVKNREVFESSASVTHQEYLSFMNLNPYDSDNNYLSQAALLQFPPIH